MNMNTRPLDATPLGPRQQARLDPFFLLFQHLHPLLQTGEIFGGKVARRRKRIKGRGFIGCFGQGRTHSHTSGGGGGGSPGGGRS